MSYPKQAKSQAEIDAALRRLRFLVLCEKLESEDTCWEKGDPIYLGLRREAAAAIRELMGSVPAKGIDRE